MSKLFLEILDKDRRDIFSKLVKFSSDGVLAGGTAIALQIGHRLSYDFDIFTNKPIAPNLWTKVKQIFGRNCVKTMGTKTQLNFYSPTSIRMTFYFAEFPPLFPTVKTNSIDLFDLRDLATNKAYTIGQRGKWRDYVDLYFLIKGNYISMDELVALSVRRYKSDFPEKLFLEQLSYFGDLDDFDIKYCADSTAPVEIKGFLVDAARRFIDSRAIS